MPYTDLLEYPKECSKCKRTGMVISPLPFARGRGRNHAGDFSGSWKQDVLLVNGRWEHVEWYEPQSWCKSCMAEQHKKRQAARQARVDKAIQQKMEFFEARDKLLAEGKLDEAAPGDVVDIGGYEWEKWGPPPADEE